MGLGNIGRTLRALVHAEPPRRHIAPPATPVPAATPQVGAPPAQDALARGAATPLAVANLPPAGPSGGAAPAGATVARAPAELDRKLEETRRARELCRRFIEDRHSLDADPSIEWVEGWHGVHQHNLTRGVPGILEDQGLLVQQPGASFMPAAAYWHPKKPETPQYWTSAGAMVHFRVPKLLLESLGKHVKDPSAGNRFSFNDSPLVKPPCSKANRYIDIMPIEVLQVYFVRGAIPDSCVGLGVDLTGQSTWPAAPAP